MQGFNRALGVAHELWIAEKGGVDWSSVMTRVDAWFVE